jgi:hypothetical protein
MKPRSIRKRIRHDALPMFAVTIARGSFALPSIHRRCRFLGLTRWRNSVSIAAVQKIDVMLDRLQLTLRNPASAEDAWPGC